MDKARIQSKLKELDCYLEELEEIAPSSLKEYCGSIEKKRACERLIQILIECVIDVCALLVKEMRLGVPSDDESIIDLIEKRKILPNALIRKVRGMKSLRNILTHKYGCVDDELVFENLSSNLGDFNEFREKVLSLLKLMKE